MKIVSRSTGDVIEIGEDGARALIEAGVYDLVEPEKKEPKKRTAQPERA